MNDKTKEMISDITEYWYFSDCCGAPIVAEDICSECREHCECEPEEEDIFKTLGEILKPGL